MPDGQGARGRCITTIAGKGGAGKTLTTVNLAAALAELGHRVLLVDADPQGAAGNSLSVDVGKPTLYEVLMGTAAAAAAIETTKVERLHLLPADLDLAGAQIELPRRQNWQLSMRNVLGAEIARYDFTLIDTPPGLAVLPFAALVAGNAAIIPCRPEYGDFRTVPSAQEAITQARRFRPDLRFIGIVPTIVEAKIDYDPVGRPLLKYDDVGDGELVPQIERARTVHEREVLTELFKPKGQFGQHRLRHIPRRVVVQDAGLAGEPVTVFAPYSDAAEAFRALAKEVKLHG
jgi:chromosome partitioning protein